MDNVDIHGYYPYPRKFIHYPWIFIWIHPDTFMVVPTFNPSLPLLDPPPALNLLQLPGAALTEASGPSVDDVLLNLHARTH